jgi:hypothetical protein
MADALITQQPLRHARDPRVRHGYADRGAHFNWTRSDDVCRYLLGQSSESVDIVELNREKEQVGDKKRR